MKIKYPTFPRFFSKSARFLEIDVLEGVGRAWWKKKKKKKKINFFGACWSRSL